MYIWFGTYHGACVMSRNIFDWYLCIISILDEEAQPHGSMPQVHTGLRITLYINILFSSDSGECLPSIQYNSLALRLKTKIYLSCTCKLMFVLHENIYDLGWAYLRSSSGKDFYDRKPKCFICRGTGQKYSCDCYVWLHCNYCFLLCYVFFSCQCQTCSCQ